MSTTFLISRICCIHKGFRGDVRFSYCVDVYGREVKLSSVTLDFFKCPQTQYLQGFPTLLPIFLLCNRYIRKTVKNDRFLYIPSKFYSRNSYILQGFSDFCLIPYYEEKVSNEDVNVDAANFNHALWAKFGSCQRSYAVSRTWNVYIWRAIYKKTGKFANKCVISTLIWVLKFKLLWRGSVKM